jgi:cell division GTPase FtsZ
MVGFLIGAGHAGSALLDAVCKQGAGKNLRIAINPKAALKHIGKKEQYLLTDKGFFGSGENEVGRRDFADVSASASAMESYDASLLKLLNDNIKDARFAILFLGLGGITGPGISPTIARTLGDLGIPIMVFGVLPARTGTGADTRAQYRNVGYAVEHLRKYTDAFILMDNQRIAYTSNIESAYPHYNQYAAAVISDILSGSDPNVSTASSLSVREIMSCISLPEGGFSVFGRASVLSKDLPGYFIPIGGHKPIDVPTLIGVAVEKQSMKADTKAARKSTALLRVPPWYMKKENAIDTGSIERFLHENSPSDHYLGISLTKRRLVTLTMLFTYQYGDLSEFLTVGP